MRCPAPGYLVLVRDVIPAHVVAAVTHLLEPVDHGDELNLAGLRRETELSVSRSGSCADM